MVAEKNYPNTSAKRIKFATSALLIPWHGYFDFRAWPRTMVSLRKTFVLDVVVVTYIFEVGDNIIVLHNKLLNKS